MTANTGWVNVGADHETAAFAVESIRRWWKAAGAQTYPGARQLLITADCGGSNGSRRRLWKVELAQLAEPGIEVTVVHLPPGRQQVEQNRAPAVLGDLDELAGPSAPMRLRVRYERLLASYGTDKTVRLLAHRLTPGKATCWPRHADPETESFPSDPPALFGGLWPLCRALAR